MGDPLHRLRRSSVAWAVAEARRVGTEHGQRRRMRRTSVAVAVCAALACLGTHKPSPPQPSELAIGALGPTGPASTDPWSHLFLPPDATAPSSSVAVTPAAVRGPVPGGGAGRGALGGARLRWTGIPAMVLDAYRRAAAGIGQELPGCNLTWPVLAAIGRIESGHARAGDLNPDGTTRTPIVGPQLDGTASFAVIGDSDGGSLDGDTAYDRAVGPMQFLPGTWRRYARDGNGDSKRDPHNVFDATLGAAAYLCAGGRDLSDPARLRAAVFAYNHSVSYVNTVLAWAQAYATGAAAYNAPLPVGAPVRPRAAGGPVIAVQAPATPGTSGTSGTPGTRPAGTTTPTTPGGRSPTTGSPSTSPTTFPPTPTTPGATPGPTGTIAGSVIDDTGRPIGDVLITLTGPVNQTTSSGADGAFSFGALPQGTYTVSEGRAAGYLDESANEFGGVQLGDGQRVDGLRFVERSATLAGRVFVDVDGDGKDGNEQGIPNVELRLVGADVNGANVDRIVLTGTEGVFEFTGLPEGVYTIFETQPADYVDGADSAPAGEPPTPETAENRDQIRNIPVAPGGMLGGFSFGELPATSGSTAPATPSGDGSGGAGTSSPAESTTPAPTPTP